MYVRGLKVLLFTVCWVLYIQSVFLYVLRCARSFDSHETSFLWQRISILIEFFSETVACLDEDYLILKLRLPVVLYVSFAVDS